MANQSPRWPLGKRKHWAERFARRHLPIITWLPLYNSEQMVADLIAGVTVGLTVMPQALAYATLAGLEPQYGLYSSFIGCFVYMVFGSCKDITIGPTALMALMTYQQVSTRNPDFAVLLCFLSGIIQMLMGILHLGVLIDFISIPVTVGFTSATSVIIAASQLKSLLGLKFISKSFMQDMKMIYLHIGETVMADTLLGTGCIVILLLLRKLKDYKPKGDSKRTKVFGKAIWLLSTSRNALMVIGCSVVAFSAETWWGGSPFSLTGTVRSGMPEFGLPPFSTTFNNQTYNFVEMCSELGSSIILVPVIAVLGNVAISKAFASGDTVNATQELVTLSLCNILGAFARSMPITGSFSRSAVNHASGVKTPLGGLYTGVLVLLALSLLTPYFYFIPKATLAAVIICAVIFMIEYEVVKPMWRSNRKDLVPTFVTFLICLLTGVEIGILLGVAVNLVFLLYPSARPSMHVEKNMTTSGVQYLLVTPGNSLYFPGVDYIRTTVSKAATKQGGCQLPVIVDCRYVLGADFTAAKGIAALAEEFSRRNQPLVFYNPREAVVDVFKGAAITSFQYVNGSSELDILLNDFAASRSETLTNGVFKSIPDSDRQLKSSSLERRLTSIHDNSHELTEVIAPGASSEEHRDGQDHDNYSAVPLLNRRNDPTIRQMSINNRAPVSPKGLEEL